MNKVFIAATFSTLAACGSGEIDYKPIKASKFINYGVAPFKHTMYMGSDKKLHYFSWASGKDSGYWKINKKELLLNCEMELGESSGSFMDKSDTGVYKPWACQ